MKIKRKKPVTQKKVYDSHLEDLRKSGLTDATIEKASLYSVDRDEVIRLAGWCPKESKSALVIPFEVGFMRLKLFPEGKSADGKTTKYLQKKGTTSRLYFPPGVKEEIEKDLRADVYIVEGEKKALRLWQEGFLVVGLTGIWNWLEKGIPIPDFAGINWNERTAYLVPDSDVLERSDLLKGLIKLAKEIEGTDGSVYVKELPSAGEGKIGLDDYLTDHGDIDSFTKLRQLHIEELEKRLQYLREHQEVGEESESLPLIHISAVQDKEIDYLVDHLLIRDTVGLISAQPGQLKTWLSLELAVSVASGTKALGHFEARKGKVIAFNAEDDPSRATKARLSALAKAKGLKLEDLDIQLIDMRSLVLNDPKTQSALRETLRVETPDLLILDPFRQVHLLNEDKSSDMAPLFEFLRSLQREFHCIVLLVCHDRKPGMNDGENRGSQTRGSNAIHGWRDVAFYLDKSMDAVKVQVYHRGAQAPEPFHFELKAVNKDLQLVSAELVYVNEFRQKMKRDSKYVDRISAVLKRKGVMGRKQLREAVGMNNKNLHRILNEMMLDGTIKEFKDSDGLQKVKFRFRNPASKNNEA